MKRHRCTIWGNEYLNHESTGLAPMEISKGECVLVPAEVAAIDLSAHDAEILEVFVP